MVPGRVNLIGEHIDYHDLPVLPIAIARNITLDVIGVTTGVVSLSSELFGSREVNFSCDLEPAAGGDWANYLKAAVRVVKQQWNVTKGFSGQLYSTLPAAAGLSSSSALLISVTLALLHVNDISPKLDELMAVLPEAEHFVGTRGGGMDHAAILASRAGSASLISFDPFDISYIPMPHDWRFLIANSLIRAEKAGPAKVGYNACRAAGLSALEKYKLASFSSAQVAADCGVLTAASPLTLGERNAFSHVCREAERVHSGVFSMLAADRQRFGSILNDSHASLRDLLGVSCAPLDRIVEIANQAGADGARLTGAGFGGSAVILCSPEKEGRIVAALERDFYSAYSDYNRQQHLFLVTASDGALHAK